MSVITWLLDCFPLFARRRDQRTSQGSVIETPQALGERFWTELQELIDQGEISTSDADLIKRDMFEESTSGKPPKLRASYWRAHLAERTGNYS